MWDYICNKLKVPDISESLQMTFSIINFSLSFFFTLFFSTKVIFEHAVTLSVKKGLTVLKNVLLSVTSVVSILPKNVCFAFLIIVTQYLHCLLYAFLFISLLVFQKLFLSRDRFIISLVIVFLMKGSLVCSNISFFQGRMFLKSNADSFFGFFKRKLFPAWAELKKMYFRDHKNFIWKFLITSILNNMWFLFGVENFQYS